MPLPFDRPQLSRGNWDRNPVGLDRIDKIMDEDTANKLKQEYNPNYRGSGTKGIATHLGEGKIGKLTDSYAEMKFADYIKNNPCPNIVKVHNIVDAQNYKNNSTRRKPIWMIVMDEVKVLTAEQKKVADDSRSWGWRRMSAGDAVQRAESSYRNTVSKYPNETELIDKLFELGRNLRRCRIAVHDAWGCNIGFDKNENLVVIDLGSIMKA